MTGKKQNVIKIKRKNERLLEWLNGMPKANQIMWAERMETSIGQLRQIGHGVRPCSVRLAIEIDKASGGFVPMTLSAPDIDWDYIRLNINART